MTGPDILAVGVILIFAFLFIANATPFLNGRGSAQPSKHTHTQATANTTQQGTPQRHWKSLVNYPALFLYGTMGSGKSTLCRAILSQYRNADLLVIDPKRERWYPNAVVPEIVDGVRSWDKVQNALKAVVQEVAIRTDVENTRSLVIVLDDLPVLAKSVPKELAALLGEVLIIGRSLHMHIILIGHSNRAGMSGTKGMHDVLLALPTVQMDNYNGIYIEGGKHTPLITSGTASAAGKSWHKHMQAWAVPEDAGGVRTITVGVSSSVRESFGMGVPTAFGTVLAHGNAVAGTGTGEELGKISTEKQGADGDLTDQQVLDMIGGGVSQRKILALMKGSKASRVARYKSLEATVH